MRKDLHWPQYLLIAVAVLIVFGQTIGFDFLSWDDGTLIFANPFINPPTLKGVVSAWRAPHERLYIPLVYNLWTGIAAVAQTSTPDARGVTLNPFVFHLANVSVHLANALLAYGILLILFGRRWIAATAAVVWAIHPFQVEPVAWATGMKDLLSGALALLAILLYLHGAKRHGTGRASKAVIGLYLAAAVSMALATLAKPGVVGIPLFAIVLDLLVLGRPVRRVIACSAPLVLAVIPAVVITSSAQAMGHPWFIPAAWTRPLIAGHALWVYLHKLVWPDQFAFQYDLAPIDVMKHSWVYWAWLAPAGVTAAILLYRPGRRVLLAGWLIFLAGVGPVLGLVPFVFQYYSTVTDRYMYLSMLGVAIAFAYLLTRLKTRNAALIAAAVILVLMARSAIQATNWADTRTLMAHTIRVNPRSFAALSTYARLITDEGIDLNNTALALPKEDPRRSAMLAQAQSTLEEAEQDFLRAIAVREDHIASLNSLAELYATLGNLTKALDYTELAADKLENTPDELASPAADRKTIGQICMNLHQYARAQKNLRRYLEQFPRDPEAKDLLKKAQAAEASANIPATTQAIR